MAQGGDFEPTNVAETSREVTAFFLMSSASPKSVLSVHHSKKRKTKTRMLSWIWACLILLALVSQAFLLWKNHHHASQHGTLSNRGQSYPTAQPRTASSLQSSVSKASLVFQEYLSSTNLDETPAIRRDPPPTCSLLSDDATNVQNDQLDDCLQQWARHLARVWPLKPRQNDHPLDSARTSTTLLAMCD